jgi:hypothetical protein
MTSSPNTLKTDLNTLKTDLNTLKTGDFWEIERRVLAHYLGLPPDVELTREDAKTLGYTFAYGGDVPEAYARMRTEKGKVK